MATELKNRVQSLVDRICENKITSSIYPPVFLVLLNRGFDLTTPFMASNCYAS